MVAQAANALSVKPVHGPPQKDLGDDGTLVTVGMLERSRPQAIDFWIVSLLRVSVAGSLIGSVAETQQVLDFCVQHGITADVDVIAVDHINAAYDEVVAKTFRFRHVIDNSAIQSPAA